MNLPNKLTVLRIMLVPFMVAALLIYFPHHFLVAGLLFGIASITDCLDGRIARKYNLVSDFGKFADPLADKILVISALVCFVQLGLCSSLIVIITLFREFTVTSMRLVSASKGKVVAANTWGKAKTISQIVAIVLVFVLQYALEILNMGFFSMSTAGISQITYVFEITGEIALWISTVFTIVSGIIYIKDNKQFISNC